MKPLIEDLNKEKFEIIIHPVCHREFAIDYLIKKIKAKEKVGYSGTSMNQGELERSFTDKYYTRLIKTNQKFEFNKNKELFEKVMGEKIDLPNPKININKKQNNYFVINPGASVKFKQWAPKNFAKVIDYLIEKYKSKIYIVGSKTELELDNKVKELSKHKNKIEIKNGGKLIDLLKLIAGSRGVISNETCTPHIAVALNKKVYCISGKLGYERMHPYPKYEKAIYCYPPNMDNINQSEHWGDNTENLDTISTKKVISKLRF